MKDNDSRDTEPDQLNIINEQIQEALKDIERIIEKKIIVKDAIQLEDLEKEIIKATDKLAGLLTAQKIQQSIDSDEMKTEAKKLVRTIPKKLKNQGRREVEIYPSRGGAVRVKASYFSKKGKKK
jgi:predicted RNA-binding protein with PUA domain